MENYSKLFHDDDIDAREEEEFNKKMNAQDEKENQINSLFDFFKKLGIGIGLIAVLIILLSGIFVVTNKNEYTVIKQFGKIVRVEEEAGLSLKIPLIQNQTKIDKNLLFYDLSKSDVITSDKKTMIVDSYIIWKITDPAKYIKTLGGSNITAEARINTIVYNAIKNTISGLTQEEVIKSRDGDIIITEKNDEINTNDIVSEKENVQITSISDKITKNISDYSDYGITIERIEIRTLDLPDSNKAAVYSRMISERANVAASYEAEGKSEAKIITNTTDKEVSIMLAEAKSTAAKTIAEGEAEYMRILSEAYNDESKSEFYRFVRSLDTAKVALKNNENILVLDESSPIYQIFYNK